jgi:formate/nitrite transporter FocA (FNT family)
MFAATVALLRIYGMSSAAYSRINQYILPAAISILVGGMLLVGSAMWLIMKRAEPN